MNHYFLPTVFEVVKKDVSFLIGKIKQSYFEYDFQIRENYFNLYYRGNSIGKVRTSGQNEYKIIVHEKFVTKTQGKFNPKRDPKSGRLTFVIAAKKLPSFYSAANLKTMAQKVKDNNFQEELAYEQMLIAANVGRPEFIIIDRQVMDGKSKMDILALAKVKGSDNYQFCVIEVKLGNNRELAGHVSKQLKGYQSNIENKFGVYKECYERNFKQKQEFGLFEKDIKVNIVPDVLGIVVVGGYSGLAMQQIGILKETDPNIKVLPLVPLINPMEAR
jgi:hypothetical protein